jgi:hypothetical protein
MIRQDITAEGQMIGHPTLFTSTRYVYEVDRPYPFEPSDIDKIAFYVEGAQFTYVAEGKEFRLEVVVPPGASEDLPKRVSVEKVFAPLASKRATAKVYLTSPSNLPLRYVETTSYDAKGLVATLKTKGLVDVLNSKLVMATHDHQIVALTSEVEVILGSKKVEVDFLLTPQGVGVFTNLAALVSSP